MGRYRDRGDEAAFRALFERYAGRLEAFFSRGLGPRGREGALDLVQKTFLHVHRARRDYDQERPFKPWIYTIALNVRREEGRRFMRSREVPVDPQDGPEIGVEAAVSSASDRLVRRALGELSDSQREVVLLHWFEGLSFPEIAELLGATVSAVKVRAHRAYGELRRLLGEPG